MRTARIKPEGRGFYHCMSRVIEKRNLLRHKEKEHFRVLMRRVEKFSCIHILTHSILDNHWHMVIEVPERRDLTDEEFLERLAALYKKELVDDMRTRLAYLRRKERHEEAELEKARYTYRMFDISEFMKTFKIRFTMWYNRRKRRKGTLWDDRFKSVCIEGSDRLLAIVAAYVDLNAVRAGISSDPRDYRYCGYAEAVSGHGAARSGLIRVMQGLRPGGRWPEVSREYRKQLYVQGRQKGLKPDGSPTKRGFSHAEIQKVLESDGELQVHELLRCRVRYFSDGVAIGSREFVENVFHANRDRLKVKRQEGARPMKHGEWGDTFVMRDLRLEAVSLPSP